MLLKKKELTLKNNLLFNNPLTIELLFKYTAFFSIIFFIYTLVYFNFNQHLPPPFFYDYSDTFMDFFNPLFYADKDNKFTEWKSVYTSLSFLFAKFINMNNICLIDSADAYMLRNCNKNFFYFFTGLYLFFCFIASSLVRNFLNNKPNFIYIFLSVSLSPINLFLLERGNLYIFCLIFIVLLYFYFKNDFLSAFFISLLINLKFYFIFFPLIFFLKRYYFRFLLISLLSIAIYLCSLIIAYDPNHLNFLSNLLDFISNKYEIAEKGITNIMAGSLGINKLFIVFDIYLGAYFQIYNPVDFSLIIKLSTFLIFLYVFLSCYKKCPVELLILLTIITIQQIIDIGLYTLITSIIFLSSCYRYNYKLIYFIIALLLPYDFFSIIKPSEIPIYSWLSDSFVSYNQILNFGDIMRSCIVFILFLYISFFILKSYSFKHGDNNVQNKN